MIILLSLAIFIMINWVGSHVQLPEHSFLVTVEDKLGHFFVFGVFF